MECKKQRANNWRIRLLEEIKHDKTGKFVTLTFNEEELNKLKAEVNRKAKGKLKEYDLENAVVTKAIRRYLENWRAEHKKSVKHWYVTELGHEGTERIHIHGIMFTDKSDDIEKKWKYGFVHVGTYVNEQTINYITKYVNKADEKHKEYNSITLCSAGIGSGYFKRTDSENNKYIEGKTREYYKTRQGLKVGLPIYYRNKIYTDEEKEKLWIEKLDKQVRYINGVKVDISKGGKEYEEGLKIAQAENEKLGYGGREDWEKEQYERELKKLKKEIKETPSSEEFCGNRVFEYTGGAVVRGMGKRKSK